MGYIVRRLGQWPVMYQIAVGLLLGQVILLPRRDGFGHPAVPWGGMHLGLELRL